MTAATLYKMSPAKGRMIDAHVEFDRTSSVTSAVILHSRSGHPLRNNEYADALSRIIERLHPGGRISSILIDSNRHAELPRNQRILFTGAQLTGLSAGEATHEIRQALLRFGQKSDAKGGNSTKRVRIETHFPLHSLITSLRARKVSVAALNAQSTNRPVPRAKAQKLLADVPHTDEDLECVENEKRMAAHYRTERSRSSKLLNRKRKAIRAANQGRYKCENEECPADWYAVFPHHIADGVFEVHHRVPLSSDDEPVINTVDDLQMLCASCHRAAHRRLASL